MKNTKKNISIEKLHPFENHPYKVQDNEEMDALAESIKAHGVVYFTLAFTSFPILEENFEVIRSPFQVVLTWTRYFLLLCLDVLSS